MPRPKGYPKTGGRKAGSQNKNPAVKVTPFERNVLNSELRRLALKGLQPLQFFLGTMRNESLPFDDRKWGAAQAAPLIHPRLITANTNITGHLTLEALISATLPGHKQIEGELAEKTAENKDDGDDDREQET